MKHFLDVRLQESFNLSHIPGSVVNPVFQMGFIDRMPSGWAKEDAIQVIGQNAESEEALMALEKLQRAGYQKVSILAEGIEGWISNGHPVDGVPASDTESPSLEGELAVDLQASELQWTGRNLLNRHVGTLKFSEASLLFEKGALTGGDFVIDWDTLVCTDLAGQPELHEVLMTHLKDHDFFDVKTHEPPRISIISVTYRPTLPPGRPNLEIRANVTLKSIEKKIKFLAIGAHTETGGYAFQAAFKFDRTEWDVKYGSGRFFTGLGMHLVNDTVEIGLKVVTADAAPTA